MLKKKSSPQNFLEFIRKLTVVFFLSISVIVVLGAIFFGILILMIKIDNRDDMKKDRLTRERIEAELKELPQVKMEKLVSWGGSSIVTFQIENQGTAKIEYMATGAPSFQVLGGHATIYPCYALHDNSPKRSIITNRTLYLGSESIYQKWFPFEIHSIKDLVERYDDLERIINTFPERDKTIPADPNFTFQDTYNGQDVLCELTR